VLSRQTRRYGIIIVIFGGRTLERHRGIAIGAVWITTHVPVRTTLQVREFGRLASVFATIPTIVFADFGIVATTHEAIMADPVTNQGIALSFPLTLIQFVAIDRITIIIVVVKDDTRMEGLAKDLTLWTVWACTYVLADFGIRQSLQYDSAVRIDRDSSPVNVKQLQLGETLRAGVVSQAFVKGLVTRSCIRFVVLKSRVGRKELSGIAIFAHENTVRVFRDSRDARRRGFGQSSGCAIMVGVVA
jgi:hypothetical protein